MDYNQIKSFVTVAHKAISPKRPKACTYCHLAVVGTDQKRLKNILTLCCSAHQRRHEKLCAGEAFLPEAEQLLQHHHHRLARFAQSLSTLSGTPKSASYRILSTRHHPHRCITTHNPVQHRPIRHASGILGVQNKTQGGFLSVQPTSRHPQPVLKDIRYCLTARQNRRHIQADDPTG